VAALRLDEQTVQPEHAGVVAVGHLLEGRNRRVAIAGELRALGAEQQGERLARRDAHRLGGEFLRRASVAGALTCLVAGAQPSLPIRAAVDARLKELAPARKVRAGRGK